MIACDACSKLPWTSDALTNGRARCICHGFNLDLACGDHPMKGMIGADKRPLTDLCFDAELFPWPIPSETVERCLVSHFLEHVKPWLMIELMDELWRVMKASSQVLIVFPHADSFGFKQDPTHCNAMNEATFTYFDPENATGLWNVYKPKPWRIQSQHFAPIANVELVLEPRK